MEVESKVGDLDSVIETNNSVNETPGKNVVRIL